MATLTEQIRQSLSRRDGVPESLMRELAQTYAVDVARVNDRLSKAVAMLHKGLRSEAIQMASLHPNAIDAAAALDFPEFDDWCEILQFYAIPLPQVLQRDLADQLNEGIVEAQPLEAILKHHRRLAIARAPLAWRLKTLRRIAQLDPTNGVWEDDIESWERARVKQLDSEVKSAMETSDEPRLRALYDELSLSAWRIDLDRGLVDRVSKAIRQIDESKSHAELARIAPLAYDAFCQFDEPAARAAVAEWNRVAATAKTPPDKALTDQIDGAMDWLAEIDRETAERAQRGSALGKLESALDRRADRHTLESAFGSLARFNDPPPVELVQRYRLAIDQIEIAGKRRNQAIVLAIVCVAAIVVGIIVVRQQAATQESAVVAAETQLKQMIDQRRLPDAQSYWQRVESVAPAVASDARLASLKSRLDSMANDEASRVAQFANYLAQADAPDPSGMDLSALAKAESLALSEDEKAAAFKVRRRYSQWDGELESAQTAGLVAKMAEIRQRLNDIERLPPDQVRSADMTAVLSAIDETAAAHPRANSAAKAQIATVRTRAVAMRDALGERRQRMLAETTAMQRVLKAGSLDQLADSLTAFSQSVPQSPLGSELATAAQERKHWDRPQRWNAFSTTVADALDKPLTAAVVNDLITDQTAMDDEIGKNPATQASGNWLDRLHRYNNRAEALQRVLGELGDTVVADLYTIAESGGEGNRHFVFHFYHDRNRKIFDLEQRSHDVVINGSGAIKRSQPLLGPMAVTPEPFDTVRWLVTQSEIAAAEFCSDWDREFLKLVGLLRNRPKLDHNIKEMLISHLLAGAAEESPQMAQWMKSELLVLSERSKKRETWYEPAPLKDTLDDEVETTVIKRVANLYRSLPTVSSDAAALRKQRYTWTGCLIRSVDGTLEYHQERQVPGDGKLFVAIASDESDDKTDIIEVGDVIAGEATLNAGRSNQMAGRPVFFIAN